MERLSLAVPEKCSGITFVENDIRNDVVAQDFLEDLGAERREEEAAEFGWQAFECVIGGCKECNSCSLFSCAILLLPPFPGEPVIQSDLLKGRSEDKEVLCKEELV